MKVNFKFNVLKFEQCIIIEFIPINNKFIQCEYSINFKDKKEGIIDRETGYLNILNESGEYFYDYVKDVGKIIYKIKIKKDLLKRINYICEN